jgi:hypothetical protein
MMDALDVDPAVAAVGDVLISPRAAGTTGRPQPNCGPDMMRATEPEAVGIFAAARHAIGPDAADWLCLAAAPTFAIMAVLTCARGSGGPRMLCSAALGMPPLSGMVPMYSLMSIFHAVPWLKMILSQSSCPGRP